MEITETIKSEPCHAFFSFCIPCCLSELTHTCRILQPGNEIGKELKLQLALKTCRFLEINDIRGTFVAYLIFHK